MKTRKREGDTTQERREMEGDRETERSREKVIKARIIKKRKKTHIHRNYNKKQKINK